MARRLALLLLAFLTVASTYATHFRYGTFTWSPTATAGQVKFDMTQAYRRSFFGAPVLGNLVGIGSINFGDGTSASVNAEVIAVDTVSDIIIVAVVNPGTNTRGYLKTYSGPGPFVATFNNCCRISNLQNGADNTYNLETSVTPLSGNSAPVSTQTPQVQVPRGLASTFSVPAADPDGDGLRWRFATAAESGFSGNIPPGMSINPNSGQITWNNNSLHAGPWTVQVMVEDLDGGGAVKSKSPVDFLLTVQNVVGNAPTIAINPPDPISVAPGTPISFNVSASDVDTGATINLTTSGLPPGATTTPTLPISGVAGLPGASTTFNWTPTPAHSGTYVVFFNVNDNTGQQSQASIQITVTTLPAPTVTTGSASGITQTGATLNGTVNPNGVNTSYRFEYGLTNAYGNSTAPIGIGAGTSDQAVAQAIGGLSLNTLYHYRVIASSAGGTSVGANQTFTTAGVPNIPPTVTLDAPANPTTVSEDDQVTFAATAADTDGSITQVEFFVAGNSVGIDFVAPFELNAGPFPVGNYLVVAVATDDDGDTATSGAATLNVVEAAPIARNDYAFVSNAVRLDPRRNDDGPGTHPIKVVAVGSPARGTVTIIEGGARIRYQATAPFSPTDSDTFTYTVENDLGRQATATVTVYAAPERYSQFVGHLDDHHHHTHGIISYRFYRPGIFSGKMIYNGKRYAIRGNLNGDSPLVINVRRGGGLAPLPLEISAGPIVDGSVTLDASIPDPNEDENWHSHGIKSPYSRNNPAPLAGRYTMILGQDPATIGVSGFPQGSGGIMLKVTSTGMAKLLGKAPDNSSLSGISFLLTGDHIPMFFATGPASRRGSVSGDISIGAGPGPQVSGSAEWHMPASGTSALYPLGFEVEMPITGASYTPASTPSGILASPAWTLAFNGGGLGAPLGVNIVAGSNPILSGFPPLGMTRINSSVGKITGVVADPATGVKRKFFSVLVQDPSINGGSGYILGSSEIGSLEITNP